MNCYVMEISLPMESEQSPIVWSYKKNSFSLETIPVAFYEPFSEICMNGRSVDKLGLWPYMVTLLNWTFIFDWHMAKLFYFTSYNEL